MCCHVRAKLAHFPLVVLFLLSASLVPLERNKIFLGSLHVCIALHFDSILKAESGCSQMLRTTPNRPHTSTRRTADVTARCYLLLLLTLRRYRVCFDLHVLNHNKFEKMDLVSLDHLCIALPPVALSRPAAKKIKRSTQQVTIHKSDNSHNTQFTHHTHHRLGTRETQHERKDVDTLEMAAAAKGRVQLLLLRVVEAELFVVPPPNTCAALPIFCKRLR